MNTTTQSEISSVDSGKPSSLPVPRGYIHFEYWLLFCCLLVVFIWLCALQNSANAIPTADPVTTRISFHAQLLFYLLLPMFILAFTPFSNKRCQKTIDYRSKGFIIRFSILGVFVLVLLAFLVRDYLSPTPPAYPLLDWLFSWLPVSTPPWDAFWQSIVLNRLTLLLIGYKYLVDLIQEYRSELASFETSTTTTS